MGINRLNVYAGLLGLYIVRDSAEEALNLPSGKYEIPLIFYDRMLDPQGQLIYPTSADPDAPWIPEFFGDALLVNGKLFPYLEVEPCKYRFRVLNGSNSRFLALSLASQLHFQQIGTDQGLLPAPVPVGLLQLAPGERADLVLDFTGLDEQQIVLKSDALPAMQFRVAKATKGATDTSALPKTLRPVTKIPESAAANTRTLSLGEVDNTVAEPMTMLLNNTHWSMPITEKPVLDSVEIWNLVNVTDDSHPIHLHLVRFQILDRRRFDTFQYQTQGTVRYTGPATPPEPGEAGWKDTVRADPGMVTRIITRFEGYTGRYVWHCHILEHEDNEMMRPYEVVAKA
jgi:spore coat protein A